MNTKTFLPLTAAALFAVCSGSMLLASQSYDAKAAAKTSVAAHVVDMPTITVRPAAEDAAYYQANKIVDLAAVTVRPAAQDLAYFLADNTARIVDMPVVTVRPSVEDIQVVAIGAATLAQQLASR
ncbi:MAG: hypothetical protein EOP92_00120 [Lysobacteraceae bacterium]|nr:MAG: hypothetical protein EOP92_00120 [Xanthomonadaceae bacterium]